LTVSQAPGAGVVEKGVPMLHTRFTDLIGCEAPVQLAGMGVSSVELATAVARAGGLGTISSGWLGGRERAARVLDAVGDVTPGALAVNVLVCMPEQVDLVDVVAPRVRLVDFFWGDPQADLIERAHHGGALASWQVGSVDEAKAAVDAGCDVIVVQGSEAGGHVRGRLGVFELLDVVLDDVSVPVLAAGGIGSPRLLAAALATGAAGARIGTRFVSAAETPAHPEYVKALVEADNDDSVATGSFSVRCPLCPSTHRVLRSALEAAEAYPDDVVGHVRIGEDDVPIDRFSFLPPTTRTTGQISAMALYAGRGVGHCRHGQTAADILHELVDGAESLLGASLP
jgi:NAD(P)H-dependent flavin oxidoreductase YrpB (nitropropane dioxygenase family)